MDLNFTPLNIQKFGPSNLNRRPDDKLTTVLVIIATITAAIFASLLFFLIQKKMQKKEIAPAPTPTIAVQIPTIIPTKIMPTIASDEANIIATASPTIVKPTVSTIPSVRPTITISKPIN